MVTGNAASDGRDHRASVQPPGTALDSAPGGGTVVRDGYPPPRIDLKRVRANTIILPSGRPAMREEVLGELEGRGFGYEVALSLSAAHMEGPLRRCRA